MEIDRILLKTMFREFWALNNELCKNATIIFLRQHDFTDKEITEWLDIRYEDINKRDLKEAQECFDEKVQETKDYFLY